MIIVAALVLLLTIVGIIDAIARTDRRRRTSQRRIDRRATIGAK